MVVLVRRRLAVVPAAAQVFSIPPSGSPDAHLPWPAGHSRRSVLLVWGRFGQEGGETAFGLHVVGPENLQL
jgi:hypothetical protein